MNINNLEKLSILKKEKIIVLIIIIVTKDKKI